MKTGAKEWLIKTLANGEPWRYIKKNFLPQLRAGAVCVIYYKREPVKETPKEVQKEEEKCSPLPGGTGTRDIFNPVIITKPLFAIKTNLLYDALSAVNLEIEVPVGKRWSVAAEGIFPWWKASRVTGRCNYWRDTPR